LHKTWKNRCAASLSGIQPRASYVTAPDYAMRAPDFYPALNRHSCWRDNNYIYDMNLPEMEF
jgi:hypothetical protein